MGAVTALLLALLMASAVAAQNTAEDTAAFEQSIATELPEVKIDRPAADGTAAHLRALDTIVGTVSDLPVTVGESVQFGRLSISVSACRFLPENPSTHSFAFVTVSENPDQPPVFDAWMIAAAPALSAMEHPRYDIWLIRCSAETESSSNG